MVRWCYMEKADLLNKNQHFSDPVLVKCTLSGLGRANRFQRFIRDSIIFVYLPVPFPLKIPRGTPTAQRYPFYKPDDDDVAKQIFPRRTGPCS